MTVELLALSNGNTSLEFAVEDREAIRAAIGELFGTAKQDWEGVAARVTFGGETFVYYAEWDDPCLISMTPRGCAMLEAIAAKLR